MSKLGLLSALVQATSMQYDVNQTIQNCIDKCVEEYWNAANYPRKKKKTVRKKMNAGYNVHLSCQSFMQESDF